MKKKLLEKDVFYLSLFICVCILAVGGIYFTNKNVNKLVSDNSNTTTSKEDEIHLIEKEEEKEDVTPTTTDSEQSLAKAKETENNKISYLGNQVIREYSETEPSYSETLEVWEIHQGIDVEAHENQEVKSLFSGKILDVYDDDKYGMSVKVQSDDDTVLIYSSLSKNTQVKKGDTVDEGQVIGYAGNTSEVESLSGVHVHLQAYKENKAINPMSLLE